MSAHSAFGKYACVAMMTTLWLCTPGVSAEVYKWVDPEGNTHYTSSPPPGQKAEAVKTAPAPGAANPPHEPQKSAPSATPTPAAGKPQPSAEPTLTPQERAERCEKAKSRLDGLQNSQRIYKTDAEGNRTRLTDEEREAGIAKAQEDIATHCN
jgi:hypothetical protein